MGEKAGDQQELLDRLERGEITVEEFAGSIDWLKDADATFTRLQITRALFETISEQAREPSTSVWASFWDRLENS